MAFTPMFRKPFTQLVGESSAAAVQTYQEKVVALSPIAYWPLTEASGTAAVAVVGTNGTYARDVSTMGTGDGPIAGQTAPVFDGTNDYVNIYSAALNAAMSKTEVTIGAWFKVSGVGVWTDGASRYVWNLQADGNNIIGGLKSSTNNYLAVQYRAGGTAGNIIQGGISTIDWYFMTMTINKAGDELKAYGAIKGGILAQIGATQNTLGVWAGDLSSIRTLIGATITTPLNLLSGQISNMFIVNGVLSLATLQSVMA